MKTQNSQTLGSLPLLRHVRQVLSLLCLLPVLACQGQKSTDQKPASMEPQSESTKPLPTTEVKLPTGMKVATFANGCFWCTEAVFQDLKGVDKVESGFSGGFVKNPSYREACNGTTGHAEVLQIIYDPKVITFEKLLEVFWQTHDPTTLNRQGNDVGTQYRSGIYYHDDEQKKLAEAYKAQLEKDHTWSNPIVTEITPFANFYKAEDYHQNYFKLNGDQPYCQFVVRPKVDKFKKQFAKDLK